MVFHDIPEDQQVIPTDPQQLQDAFVDTVMWEARQRLKETDWKVIRHLEEQATGQGSTLTDNEWSVLVEERKAIRDWSNEAEQIIRSSVSREELLEKGKEIKAGKSIVKGKAPK